MAISEVIRSFKMAVAVTMFRWLDLLEKEFDKAFVDLDLLLGEIDPDQSELTYQGRQKLTSLSSSFAQLAHKAQTVFQSNAKLEAELVDLRSEKTEGFAKVQVLEKELKNTLLQLHAVQLQLHSSSGTSLESDAIKTKLESELSQFRKDAIKEAKLEAELVQYKRENEDLRQYILQLQGEVYGARLAAKYLDKELAGRIQQIQLLGRDMRGHEHDLLWNQIEAEIHLHRHKTVVRACRSKKKSQDPPAPDPPEINEGDNAIEIARKKRGIGDIRVVKVFRDKKEGLGISITGGKEHGVPILISEVHEGMPAAKCTDLYIGDAILSVNGRDMRSVTHAQAVHILSRVHGEIQMELFYVDPEESDDENEWENDESQRYSMLGLVEDPSEFAMNGDTVLTNTCRDPLNSNETGKQTRRNINEVLDLNLRIDSQEDGEQSLRDRQRVSLSPPITTSNSSSYGNSSQNSIPSSPSSKSTSTPVTPNVESPPVGYSKTSPPGTARRYVRT